MSNIPAVLTDVFSRVGIDINSRIIVAVSGGVDSMVLLECALKTHPKKQITVAHFDHQIREDSHEDKSVVERICRTEGVSYVIGSANVPKIAKTKKMSIEAAARETRYTFLEEVRVKNNADFILTAHHSGDQTETIFMNLIKGAKLTGLMGMCEINGYIVRAFLRISKSEIMEYARENSIEYREDTTNSDLSYQRNRVRLQIIPEIEKINPAFSATMAKLAEYTTEIVEEVNTILNDGILRNFPTISAREFETLSPFFQRECVRLVVQKMNGGTIGLSPENIEEICRYFTTARGGTHKELLGIRLTKKQNIISIDNIKRSV